MSARRTAAQVPATRRRLLSAACVVAGAAAAWCAPPAVAGSVPETFTFGARSTGADTIAVSGSVNAHGQETTLRIRYDTAGSAFCQAGGQGGSPSTGAATTAGGAAEGEIEITATQDGLPSGTELCVQLTGSNGSGPAQPSGLAQVVVGAPEVAVQFHQGTGPATARVVGEIWTAGQPTVVHAEYAENEPVASAFCASAGASGAHATTPDQLVAAATSERTVAVALEGLDPARGYCFRFVADTASAPPVAAFTSSFRAGGPGVTTLAPAAIGPFGATLRGTVQAAGSAALARFDVAPSASDFCLGGGIGAPTIVTADIPVPDTGQGVPVEAAIGSLLPLTGYCARVAASNDRDETVAAPVTFSTLTASTPETEPGAPAPSGAGTVPGPAGPASAAPPALPFGALSAQRIQYARRLRAVAFTAVVGRAGSDIVATLRLRGAVIGVLRTRGGPGPLSRLVPISARGRRLLGTAKRATVRLTVTVTAPGGKPSSRQATVTLVRGRGPCAAARASGAGARTAC